MPKSPNSASTDQAVHTPSAPFHAVRSASVTESTADILYRIMTAAYWVLLTRILAKPIVGDLAFANAVAMPTSVMLDAGFRQLLIREFRTDLDIGLPRALRHPLRLRYIAFGVGALFVTSIVASFGGTAEAVLIGAFIAAAYACESLGLIWLTRTRAELNLRHYLAFRLSQGVGVLCLTICLWRTALYSGVAIAAANTVAAAASSLLAFRTWRSGPRWSRFSMRGVDARSGQRNFAAFSIVTATYTRLDAIVVQLLFGPAVLATYTVAFKLIEAARVVPGAVARALLAASTRFAHTYNREQSATIIVSSFRVAVVLSILLITVGPAALSVLFGNAYARHAVAIVQLLAVTLPALGITGPMSSIFLAVGRERSAIVIAAWTLCATATAVIALSLVLGPTGVAAGVLAGEMVSVGLYLLHSSGHVTLTRTDGTLAILVAVTLLASFVFRPLSAATLALGLGLAALGALLIAWLTQRPPSFSRAYTD